MSVSSHDQALDFSQLEFVYLELTVKCNLACTFCDNSMRNLYRDVKPDQFRHVVDQLKPGTRLALHGLGEPTLHKGVVELVAHAKSRGLYVYFNTNHTVTSDEQMEGFVAAELDEMRISMSAGSGEGFAAYAGKDLFADLVERTRRMVEIRGERTKPLLRIVFVLTLQSYREFPRVLEIARDAGVDEVMVQTHLDWGKPPGETEPDEGCRVDEKALAEARKTVVDATRASTGVKVLLPFPLDGELPAPGLPGQCRWPFNATWITADGHVTPCCNLHDPRDLSFGNAFTGRLADVWTGRPYQDFRRQYRQNSVTACQTCPVHDGRFKSYAYEDPSP